MNHRAPLFALIAPVLLFQGCLTGSGGGQSGGAFEGKWMATRVIEEWSEGGVTYRDTTAYDTTVYGREFLLVQGTGMSRVFYNFSTQRADTTIFPSPYIDGMRWFLGGDTVTFSLTGNLLAGEFSGTFEGYSYSVRTEFMAYAGVFPPAQWSPVPSDTTGSGLLNGTWMATRAIAEWTGGGVTERDTISYDTAEVYERNFFRIRGDTVSAESYGESEIVSVHRISATSWVDTEGDTLTITRTGNLMVVAVSFYDEEFGEHFSVRIEFVAYTRAFPPPEWATQPVDAGEPNDVSTQATPITVNAAARLASLTPGDVDWYSFQAQAGKAYRIRTYGNADTYLRLYGTNATTQLDSNDDYEGLNAGLTWTFSSAGTYYFTVRGYDDSETGVYSVSVVAITDMLAKPSAGRGGARKPRWL